MMVDNINSSGLPSGQDIRRAVELYLRHAYPSGVPEAIAGRIPPEVFDPAEWLMSESVERDPPDAPLGSVRSFAMRLGNVEYPNMKLRLSRPLRDKVFLFSVDSHDAVLHAPSSSADRDALEALKVHNAAVASMISAALDAAGLATDRNYLRNKISKIRETQDDFDVG